MVDPIAGAQAPAMQTALNQGADNPLSPAMASAEEGTLGDKFFQILSDAKQDISTRAVDIDSALRVDNISPSELLRLQYEIAEITIQQELISKGVSKSTQNVDTLLKAQ